MKSSYRIVAATIACSSSSNLISKTKDLIRGPEHTIPVLVEVRFFSFYLSSSKLNIIKEWSSSLQVAAINFSEGDKHTVPTESLRSFVIMN